MKKQGGIVVLVKSVISGRAVEERYPTAPLLLLFPRLVLGRR